MSAGPLTKALRQRFERWLDRRQPATNELTLTQGIIYILPNRFGCWFALLIVLLYLLGTNYQNNLMLLVSFVLLSIFLCVLLLAFFNLYKLQLSVVQDAETYAPDAATLTLQLCAVQAQMLQLSLKGQRQTQLLPLLQGSHPFVLAMPVLERGCYPLPRLRVSSCYPLGLFQVWSYPALAVQIWVYPTPLTTAQADGALVTDEKNNLQDRPVVTQQAEPNMLKQYQPGDSPRQILWKKLPSAPQQPVVRQRSQQTTVAPEWVQVPPLQGAALEQALSLACQQLLLLEQQGNAYGLQTATTRIVPASGAFHLRRCLQELALC